MLVVLLVVVWPGPHASQADKLGGGLRALMLVAYAILTTLGMPFVAQYKLGAAVLHAALLSSFAGGVVLLARRAKADESELRAGETSRRDDDVRLREAHRALARELTTLVHCAETTERVESAARALFGQGDLTALDEKTLPSALAELPRTTVSKNGEIPTWVDLLAATGVVETKSAARRVVKDGGAYLNNVKVTSEDFAPPESAFLYGKYAVLRKGKRDLAAVELI